ncbi:MAG: DNA-3-methyladenine glycosylase I [Burkholderiales bacterium]|nr:DNA-3-methyladenine glycosylase I [Burkholderiales bacterium]
MPNRTRCAWAKNPRAVAYHDREWGVPVRAERRLFELLVLEGAQAGLSWDTVLAKRARYRAVFDNFDPAKVARYGARRKAQLLADPGIIRNRAKIDAAVLNARGFLALQDEFGSFARYLWGFVDGRPLQNRWRHARQVPARSVVSDALSKDLKRRGFKFVGTTIMYAYMQAVGMVNDHTLDCFRHRALAAR